ncbi:DUF998 domain-containing protein [Actinoplanes bogorensis]|uniref:DUF998 domain-containing protein n=1 Tax=Paractinoplanes bogorensis TaxID=1610840 RepID=A0ABS5YH92_9ACTN|nr:DUF998 domain-containing protein [Actinoplanes bogorensis]MBU2662088.1 DUF998 domain-containing protein [Actinoplanes bogorensis]
MTSRIGRGALLTAGMWAGPFFVVSVVAQMLTRDGFDLRRQPISQLAIGELGWIQSATFVLTGLAVVALAAGLERRTLTVFVGLFGAGLVVAGLFKPDAMSEGPDAMSEGAATMSEGAATMSVHAAAAVLAFTALAVACVVHTIRSIRRRDRVAAVLSGIVAVVLLLPMSPDHASVQLALTGLVSFGWTTAIARSASRRSVR